jgi:hypothetical protein
VARLRAELLFLTPSSTATALTYDDNGVDDDVVDRNDDNDDDDALGGDMCRFNDGEMAAND